jgi:hypothetical protein
MVFPNRFHGAIDMVLSTQPHGEEHDRPEIAEYRGDDSSMASEIAELLKGFGGRREARTRGLGVANAARTKGHLVGASAHRRIKGAKIIRLRDC